MPQLRNDPPDNEDGIPLDGVFPDGSNTECHEKRFPFGIDDPEVAATAETLNGVHGAWKLPVVTPKESSAYIDCKRKCQEDEAKRKSVCAEIRRRLEKLLRENGCPSKVTAIPKRKTPCAPKKKKACKKTPKPCKPKVKCNNGVCFRV